MKNIYLLFTLLAFFSQNAFSQDFSKMSANEKAKVIIYGDLYPYSLLLESGTDTLRLYQPPINLYLVFKDGKLTQVVSQDGDTTTFDYNADKIDLLDTDS